MKKIISLQSRLEKLGIEVSFISNYPWIYLATVNRKRVIEKFHSDYGFTIAFSSIKNSEEIKFTDIQEMFKIIRKYV